MSPILETPSTPHTLSAYDYAVVVPGGWDVRIGIPAPGPHGASNYPIVHAANFVLPARRQDFGGEVVAEMTGGQVFVALLGYGPSGVLTGGASGGAGKGHGLFSPSGLPRPLDTAWFDPYQMQRPVPGMAGMQRFFTAQGRKFCLYAVIGSFARRSTLVPLVNGYLAGVTIHAAARASKGAP